MGLFLGTPGRLIALPEPDPGVSATVVRRFGVHDLLGGGRVVDRAAVGRREWRLSWQRLSEDEFAVLEAFHTGAFGPGPWVLVSDDIGWNWLTPNQASGTDVLGTADGFTVGPASGETAVPQWGGSVSGFACLAWTVPTNATSGRLWVVPPLRWPFTAGARRGVPVVPGAVYTFAVSAAADVPVTVRANAGWLDANGEYLPAPHAGPPAVLGPTYQRLSVTLPAPPAGAALLETTVSVDLSTVTANATVRLDLLSLTTGTVAPPWRPGGGVPVVSVTDLADRYPWHDVHDCAMTLLEVG
ncbi:hypothetical protein Val02_69220 [Virgisporangium aliadipatigenens]|uniref:Uncharacterized protein n=1 Tax=Virgisporangium aliadipatigenens TaxID=741659 RepID=A0A8J4DU74_9ACTN|nr:hypothetical protein [Virgisporangium aliadipatigenens]GIJ50036.1 hypothetical protein Val02_69220 [Virgisporangium aliadipatigenens]